MCYHYFLIYAHPSAFPSNSSVQSGFSPITPLKLLLWKSAVTSTLPNTKNIFCLLSLMKLSPFLTSVTISSSGYFSLSVTGHSILTLFCLLFLRYLNLSTGIPWGFALDSLHFSSYSRFWVILSILIVLIIISVLNIPSFIFLTHTSTLSSRPLHPTAYSFTASWSSVD